MTSKTTSGDLVSDRYASALYDLASDSNKVDLVLKDLLSIQSLLNENKNLNFVIKSPLISSSDKLEILEKLLKRISVNKLTLTFLYVIEKNKRYVYWLKYTHLFLE